MCEQCFTAPIRFGEPFKGFHLMRARRNGGDWLKGEWALIETNDPTYTWISTPQLIESSIPSERSPEDFYESLSYGHTTTSYRLISACIERGYVFDVKNSPQHFTDWVYGYLSVWIQHVTPEYETEYLNKDQSDNEIDLTIGKDPHPSEEEALKKWMKESPTP